VTTDYELVGSNAGEATLNIADEGAIRALYQRLIDGWNRGSGDEFAAPFTEAGDLIAFDGTHFRGRAEIAPFHQGLFDRWMKGTRLVGRVETIRFLGPDVAVLCAVGGTVQHGRSKPSPERDSVQTLVAWREGGVWCLAAFQNTRVRPIGRNAATFLAWLISDWMWKVLRRTERTLYE